MQERRVRDVLRGHKLLHLPPATTVRAAVRAMVERHVAAVLVCEGERLQGIFTERDLMVRVVDDGRDPEATVLAEVMTPDPISIGPDAPVTRAALLMDENHLRHLAVLDGDQVVGLVSMRDFVAAELAAIEDEHDFEERVWEVAR